MQVYVMLHSIHDQDAVAHSSFIVLVHAVLSCAAARWFKLLQDNMSPVQLVGLSYMNKHELPMPTPPPSFNTPVLVMVGDQDVVVDVDAARETAQHFGQSDAIELQGVAHDLMLVSVCSGTQTHCCSKPLSLLICSSMTVWPWQQSFLRALLSS